MRRGEGAPLNPLDQCAQYRLDSKTRILYTLYSIASTVKHAYRPLAPWYAGTQLQVLGQRALELWGGSGCEVQNGALSYCTV